MKEKAKKWGIPLLGVVLVSAFPVTFLYFNNAGEVDFSEAVQPLAVLCAIGLAVFLAAWLFTRSPGKSSLIAGLFMLAFSNFYLLEAGLKFFFPSLHYWHTLPIVFVIWLEAAILLGTYLPEDMGKMASGVLCLVFGAMTVVNAVTGMPGLVGKLQADRQLAQAREERLEQVSASDSDQPNVYLLIFDEYANFPQMEEYYHYDNAPLKDFLTENNFTISYDSHNESTATTTIITNLMNLDYVVDDTMSESEKELLRKQGKLFTEIRNHGYDVQIIETGNFLGDSSPISSSTSSATTVAGEDLSYLVYQKTPFHPFNTINTSSRFASLSLWEEYFTSDKIFCDSPTFTIGYICFPHTPFITDENGNPIGATQYYNWADSRYYLGQYQYATKVMIKVLENLLKYDANSIIIVQSDHGARANDIYSIGFSLEQKTNPLNAVYFQGADIDEIKGLSSVNTMRAILSRLWDAQYDLLEVPTAAEN